ncbi:alpha,alpha-trehalase nth1 [Coniosporium apollinis]|uniref:Endonuclease III homolog n=1 Tax=Coniosporium apollinis TaxID=61459 RepID=A0ABQ9NNL3_9PEZI|nr:alpha,alpha-trehalase nth1 [Coniosporium apollinis]
MRTSRISRDTSKVANSLSARTKPLRATQGRTLKQYGFGAEQPVAAAKAAVKRELGDESGSELSSVPSDLDENLEPVDTTVTSLHKRKRGADTPASGTTTQQEIVTTQTPPRKRLALGVEPDTIATKDKAKKARRAPAKKIVGGNGKVKVEPPPNWEEVYNLTKEMRSKVIAPVDTMGCESLAEGHRSPRDQRFQTLIALMLSSQTKDTVTAAAMRNLQENLPGGLNLESILAVSPTQLNELIRMVGFHNNKATFIKKTAEILRTSFKGDIPDTIEGLVSLPGVGPKMAYLTMSAAWGRDEGIGVDVHVHRITNLWGWHKTRTPEETRASLEAWLPRDKWHEINKLLVGFGQTICLPVGRRCGVCVLSERGLCPGAIVGKEVKRVKKVKQEVVEGKLIKQDVEVEVERGVKAEDVDGDAVPDIEDIGSPSKGRRKPRRLAS